MVISRVLKKISKKNERMLAVLTCTILYMLMSVVGMSGWVIIFTVIDIGRNLLKEVNVPWRLYCYGGSGGFAAVFIPGSLLLETCRQWDAAASAWPPPQCLALQRCQYSLLSLSFS